MLVLTRKIGEEIVIADNIRISIVDVGSGRVKIGIVAPRSVTIDRAEVHDSKHAEPRSIEVGAVEVPDLHNRIAETLLAPDSPRVLAPGDAVAPLKLENRLTKHHPRLPKKSR